MWNILARLNKFIDNRMNLHGCKKIPGGHCATSEQINSTLLCEKGSIECWLPEISNNVINIEDICMLCVPTLLAESFYTRLLKRYTVKYINRQISLVCSCVLRLREILFKSGFSIKWKNNSASLTEYRLYFVVKQNNWAKTKNEYILYVNVISRTILLYFTFFYHNIKEKHFLQK